MKRAACIIFLLILCRYFTDTRQFWQGCTSFPPCNFPAIPRGLRFLIALELGFYLDVRSTFRTLLQSWVQAASQVQWLCRRCHSCSSLRFGGTTSLRTWCTTSSQSAS